MSTLQWIPSTYIKGTTRDDGDMRTRQALTYATRDDEEEETIGIENRLNN
jgi:hypothetical protein